MWFTTSVALVVLFAEHKVQADDDENGLETCNYMLHPETLSCCVSLLKLAASDPPPPTVSCKRLPGPAGPFQCEYAECMLTERGILQDGEINFEIANEKMDRIIERHPWTKDWFQSVQDGCTEESLAAMPVDTCLAAKYEVCTLMVTTMQCPEWKEDDMCDDLSNKADECRTALQNMRKK